MVTTPRGRMLRAPATPTRGAAMPPNPKRTMPSRDDAVPAICGYSTSASVVAGGEEIATPAASRNSDTITTHSGMATIPDASRPRAPSSGDQDAGGEGAGDAPPLGGTPGEVSERHEPGGVQSERQRVAERGEAVDVLQHERRPGQVGEQRRVQEPLIQHRAQEHPIRQQSPIVVHRLPEPSARAVGGRKGLAEHQQGHDEDAGADRRRGRRTVRASR